MLHTPYKYRAWVRFLSYFTSVSALLQNTSMANGQQFDSSYIVNFDTSNTSEATSSGGVGSSNVGLRGLGPA
ncbi:hypothetical protein [Colwellia psychrerythraea]|uniref:Uncharacterized protein n=1 Tax=Colwellia psychrerythraea TaxID=28229 RepID=A0A099KZ41_COLPS|nr:hypothetical protein [Colwellia psychrerythraea]KGJ95082.1 hypothetical protein GAB14E_1864 [Colwellia psychrerythraea]